MRLTCFILSIADVDCCCILFVFAILFCTLYPQSLLKHLLPLIAFGDMLQLIRLQQQCGQVKLAFPEHTQLIIDT